jgi:hypothetical protein
MRSVDRCEIPRRFDTPWRTAKVLSLIAALFAAFSAAEASIPQRITVSVSHERAVPGDTIRVSIRTGAEGTMEVPKAVLLLPGEGETALALAPSPGVPGTVYADVPLHAQTRSGLYIVHAWTGDFAKPTAVGKGFFIVGEIVADFFIVPMIDTLSPDTDVKEFIRSFREVGGNFLIAHNLITSDRSYFPSAICRTDVRAHSPRDFVELTLAHADSAGLAVMLSVSWDVTRNSPYKDRMKEIASIMGELYSGYAHHPSLIGFYSYQEGSGTYYASYIRKFCGHVKELNPHLLTACSPYMDDPLLAGYLSAIPSLDVIIYQAGVMASYRSDNRKKYPFRRVRDICGIGAGARRAQDKIALNHVEFFGYYDQRLDSQTDATTYDNIIRQLLSAATVTDADGVAFFTYHAHVYNPLKRDRNVEQSRRAVRDGMSAFEMITSQISHERNPLAVYVPYSDWVVERWANSFLPALDAFRVLGVPVDILPYAPPVEESILPYYPFHMNRDVFTRLLHERTVLVLPDLSGFQQTDSDLIKAYVDAGGAVVAFGPQIPMGRSYEREEIFGVREGESKTHRSLVARAGGPHASKGEKFPLPNVMTTDWVSTSATPLAVFEDGSPAILTNRYGKGMTLTVATSAWTAARHFPGLVLDALDEALAFAGHRRVADVRGLSVNSDVAGVPTPSGFRIAVVNDEGQEQSAYIRPQGVSSGGHHEWIDMVTGKVLQSATSPDSLDIRIPPCSYRCIECRAF